MEQTAGKGHTQKYEQLYRSIDTHGKKRIKGLHNDLQSHEAFKNSTKTYDDITKLNKMIIEESHLEDIKISNLINDIPKQNLEQPNIVENPNKQATPNLVRISSAGSTTSNPIKVKKTGSTDKKAKFEKNVKNPNFDSKPIGNITANLSNFNVFSDNQDLQRNNSCQGFRVKKKYTNKDCGYLTLSKIQSKLKSTIFNPHNYKIDKQLNFTKDRNHYSNGQRFSSNTDKNDNGNCKGNTLENYTQINIDY